MLAVAAAPAWAQWKNLALATPANAKGKAVSKADAAVADDADSENKLRISWLDKQTNRRQILILTMNTPASLGGLVVKASKCVPDYRAVMGQDVAWLDVTEGAEGSGRSAPWFSGWMFNTYPEIATLDHPRYDMQLLGCGEKERKIVNRGNVGPMMKPTAPVEDSESPDDAPLPGDDGKDPFYVPGVENPASETAPPPKPVEQDSEAPATTVAPVVEQAPAAEAVPVQEEHAAPIVGPQEATPPATEAQPAATPKAQEQNELHKLMDGGVY